MENFVTLIQKLCIVILIIITGFLTLSIGYDLNQDLLEKGELRRACLRWGNAIQPPRRVNTTIRLIQLRELMISPIRLGTEPIDAYIVMSSDEHQSVEIDEYERRCAFISGFNGSYGDAIITRDKAALWTDGRYHLQADEQIDCNWFLMREGFKNVTTRFDWLKGEIPKGGRVGVNPKLISQYMWQQFENQLSIAGIHLVAMNVSLIDEIWPTDERGKKRTKDAFVMDIKYTGRNYTRKLQDVRRAVKKLGADAMVVTALDEIAWLLNIRGRDTPFSPFLRCYLLLDMNNVYLYVNSKQLERNEVMEYLHAESRYYHHDTVRVNKYSDIWSDLRTKSQLYNKILVPSHCVYSEGASHAIYEQIEPRKILAKESPIIYMKAVKNQVEIDGMRKAHIKDAAAMCDFFAYIEKQMKNEYVFNEREMADILDSFRYEQDASLGNSFITNVAFAANSAHPSYVPTENTNIPIFDNGTLVIESGGQYYEGTTSVTRTVHFGEPADLMKQAYTRSLMGHMLFASLTFPDNTKMADVDILARGPLWEIGLDYLHETGHGIGAFLGVRESPIAIRYDSDISAKQTFQPGYFFTNELGYYKEGYFGVRLENVLQVIEKPWVQYGTGHSYLGFKVISLVPYQMKLVNLQLLSTDQRKWLNRYNAEICEEVGNELKRQNRMDGFYWMIENTKYVPENGVTSLSLSTYLVVAVFSVYSTIGI